MRNINHNVWPWIKSAVIFILVALGLYFIISISGCTTVSKAKQIVLTDSTAFHEVGKKFMDLNPCSNDTTINLLKGDTVTLIDFIELDPEIKTVNDTVFVTYPIVKTITRTIRDTVLRTVVDRQKERVQANEIIAKDREISRLRGLSQLAMTTSDKWEKAAGWRLFWLILAIVAGIGSHFIKFKLPKL